MIPVTQATLYVICFPRIIVVTYVTGHFPDYDTVLFKVFHCSLFTQIRHSQLTTNLFYVLFCVLPVCYDVPLSHTNKDYLLNYLFM